MSNKVDQSLDDIIAKEGISLDSSKNFNHRVVKKGLKTEDLTKVVVSVDNNSNGSLHNTNKRKVDIKESVISVADVNTASSGSNFTNTSGQIFADNLKFEVTDDDIQQLFGAFGTLKRAAVNYQNDGRSAGSALIVFERKADAETAIKSLQSVTLDERPLHLTLIDSNNTALTRNSNFNSRVKKMKQSFGGTGRQVWSDIARNYDSTPTEQRNFGRFNKSDDNKTRDWAKDKEVINAEDLDADLESYLAQRKKE